MAGILSAQLNATPGCIPSKWTRSTIADGDWLQAKTLNQYSTRDNWLAEKIEELSSKSNDDLEEEIRARIAGDTYLSGAIVSISSDFYPFSANVEASAAELNTKIDNVYNEAKIASGKLDTKISNTNNRIDNLEAATDVIAVFGTYEEFSAASGKAWQETVTDNDFIKVIRDDHYQPNQNDPDYQTTDDDVYQVYYEYHKTYHDGWIGWSAIGSLDPYYSVSEIDKYLDQINNEFDSLSATVADNYLSANENAVSAGKNIKIDYEQNKPKITINTKENVEFNNVNSKNVSSTNVTALTAQGNSAKFTNLSATNLNNVAISNLFGSAYSGANASAWLDANTEGTSAKYAKSAGSATIAYQAQNLGNVGSADVIGSAENGQFAYNVINTATVTGYNGNTPNTAYLSGGFAIKAGANLSLTYENKIFTLNAGDTGITAISAGDTKYTGPVFRASAGTGINFVNDSNNVLGIKASDSLITSAKGGSAASAYITAHSADFLNSAHNAYNKLTFKYGTSTKEYPATNSNYNFTFLAGQGIGFTTANNQVTISAEGTTYQASSYISTADKKISVTGTLITSAKAGSAASAWINNTLFDYSYTNSVDTESTVGSIDKISILYKNNATDHDVMHNQEIVFERGDYSVSGLLIQAAKNTDNGKVLTYNSTANNYTWQPIPPTTYSNDDGYISIDNVDRKIGLATTGIKTSAYSAELIDSHDHYNSILDGQSLRFSHGQNSINISLTGVSYFAGGTNKGSANWDNLFQNYAQVNRELLSTSNLSADKVNFIVASGTSDAYKAVNFVVTATLPTVLSAGVYYII